MGPLGFEPWTNGSRLPSLRQRGRTVEFGNRLGRRRRGHFAKQLCDSFLAEGRSQRLLLLFPNLSQRTGRFGKLEFHLLRLRRPNELHCEPVWGNEFCGPHVGRVPGSGQPTRCCQWRFAGRLHQSDPVRDRGELEL
jgi:hypothetical protein